MNAPPAPLTPRERETLAAMAEGHGNQAIAAIWIVSPETVKSHVRAVVSKLEARSRTHAVAIALRQGLIE